MDEMISRRAAIRWVKTQCNPYGKPTLDYESGKKVIEHLKQMPSADSEIIRCKDCKWFGDIGCAIRIVDDSDKPKENDFCSFAERRNDG